MRLIGPILLLTALSAAAHAVDICGTWKAVFTGPQGERPKMVSEMTFKLTVEGNRLTGDAHMAAWPGDGPLLDGVVDGDRFRFTVIGKSPWKAGGPQGSASGFPKLTFTGTVQDNRMEITLLWDSVMLYGRAPAPHELPMRAERTADKE
jgi:hypothetical protein